MRDRAGFFAGCADTLTQMCIYYFAAAVFILANHGWGLGLFWILLCAAVCSVIFALVLRKPRGMIPLTMLTVLLFGLVLAVFILFSETPIYFGYLLVLVIGAGMAVGVSLRFVLQRPVMHVHLLHLDAAVLTVASMLLCRGAVEVETGAAALMTVVLLMDVAAAVGLRMTEDGGDTENAFKAVLVALGGAAGLTGLVWLLVAAFSDSGAAVGAFLQGVKNALGAVFRVIEKFVFWLASFIHLREEVEELAITSAGDTAWMEQMRPQFDIPIPPWVFGVILAAVVIYVVVRLAYDLRRERFSSGTKEGRFSSNPTKRAKKSAAHTLWERLLAALRFRWMAFRRRNTPGGVLLYLERRAKRHHAPRRTGESMRCFLGRMDPAGGLNGLADALDTEYYGGQSRVLSPGECRKIRYYIRKVNRHG